MKTTSTNSESIYYLQPEAFEMLVVQLLQADGYKVTANLELHSKVDCIATKDGKSFGVIIKHRRVLSSQDVNQVTLDRSSETEIKDLLLVTSAQLTADQTATLLKAQLGHDFKIIAFDNLQELISKHTELTEQFMDMARSRNYFELLKFLAAGSIAILIIIYASYKGYHAFRAINNKLQTPANNIQAVESALESIRNLEQHLKEMKEDMILTESATREINKKYSDAKELEKLTDVQLQALKQTLQSEQWWKTLLNYALGFVLGVASSIMASVIHDRWKQQRALQSGS